MTTETRKLKIGITCYPTYGGSGVVATELGIELAARGHEIHFITSSQPFRLTGREANIHFHQVEIFHYPLFEHPPYDLALASRMAEVAQWENLDLLHVHYAIPHSLSAYLAKQMLAAKGVKLPFITTLHGTDITLVGLDRSYLPITRFGIEQSDGVTAISSYLKDRTRQAFKIERDIEVIRNFVNCDVYLAKPELIAAMRPEFASADEKLLVHLSNFRPVKRVADVIKVFARVAEAMPARLMLIGDGPDRSTCEYLARKLNVRDRIHFLGKQDNVNELLPLADLIADAVGDGVLRPGRTRGHGLPRARHRHARRRRARADRRRRQRNSMRHGRCRRNVRSRHRSAERSGTAGGTLGRRAQDRAGSLLRLGHHHQVRAVLRRYPGGLTLILRSFARMAEDGILQSTPFLCPVGL